MRVIIHSTATRPPCEETKALGSPYRVAEAMKKDDMCAPHGRQLANFRKQVKGLAAR